MTVPLLQMSAISKRFPGVVALDRVDFEVAAGEIVALVGENGAGKSTLMKILAGIHHADSGDVRVDATAVAMHGPAAAAKLGIGVIHQELEVIDTLDIAGNVFLGREPRRGPLRLLDRAAMEAATRQQLARLGVQLDPRTSMSRLGAAQRQLVAIARALSMNTRLLILDEPTARLADDDAERLFAVLRDLRAHGTGIVYVSHRLREIEVLADRAVVLRDGRNAGMLARTALTRERLVQLMVGRAIDGTTARTATPAGPVLLRVEGVRTDRYPDAEVSLDVRSGEILGIAGLVGAGRTELAEAICGVGSRLAGRVVLDGQSLAVASPRDAIRRGICLVPEDRRRHGIIPQMSVRENVTLPELGPHARLGIVLRASEAEAVRRITAALAVKAASIEAPVATLSGGNQQKVVLAKWLALRPRVLVFDEPTQGVDVGAKAEIHRSIRRLADEGAAIVMISSDLEEIVAESDRVAVMHDGHITGVLARAQCTPESIMALAVA